MSSPGNYIGTSSGRKIHSVLGITSLPNTLSKLVVDAIMSELRNTLFSQNVFVLCVCWGRMMKAENDGGVVSVKVGGKQDDRLVSALTAFPYLLREMTRGQAVELNVGEGKLCSKVPQAKLLTSFAAALLSVEEAEERTTDDTHTDKSKAL